MKNTVSNTKKKKFLFASSFFFFFGNKQKASSPTSTAGQPRHELLNRRFWERFCLLEFSAVFRLP